MRRFIIKLILFGVLISSVGEVIIRAFKLTTDVPQRVIDHETGIQLYKPGQTGYYKGAKEKWHVNDYGWIGTSNTDTKPLYSIIGDSYIENLMNPISCNQGFILQDYFNNYSFFEAGRSGVTFIEALEITKYLDEVIQPDYHLVYVGNGDFNESIVSEGRYTDRIQIDLDKNKIFKAELKSTLLKRILYSSKLLYYMYLRFPILVEKQNMGEIQENFSENKSQFDFTKVKNLFEFSSENYDTNRIMLVFHPNTESRVIKLANSYGFNYFELFEFSESWAIGDHDAHWSCYGHQEAAKQIIPIIESL